VTDRPPSDDDLVAWLSQLAAAADPVPESLLGAARDAFGLREFDARVAELIRDSAVDVPATAVRGPGPRMLSFESAGLAVECEVTPHDTRRDIFCQLVGGHASAVAVQVAGQAAGQVAGQAAGQVAVTVGLDTDGCFGVRDLPAGPVRLRCHLTDGTTLVTSWAII
jgi:hypothetical protein